MAFRRMLSGFNCRVPPTSAIRRPASTRTAVVLSSPSEGSYRLKAHSESAASEIRFAVYPLPSVPVAQSGCIVAVNKLQKSPVSNQQPVGATPNDVPLEQRKQHLKRSSSHQQTQIVVARERIDKLNGLRRIVCSTPHRRLPGGQGGAPARAVPPNATGGEPLDGAALPTREPTSTNQGPVAGHGARLSGPAVVAMGSVTSPACLRVSMSGPGHEKTRLSGSEQPTNGLLRLAQHQVNAVQSGANGSEGAGLPGDGAGPTTFALTTSHEPVLSNGLIGKKPAGLVAKSGGPCLQLLNGSTTRSACTTTSVSAAGVVTNATTASALSAAVAPHTTTGRVAILHTTAGNANASRTGAAVDSVGGGPSLADSVPDTSSSSSSSIFSTRPPPTTTTTTNTNTTVVATTSSTTAAKSAAAAAAAAAAPAASTSASTKCPPVAMSRRAASDATDVMTSVALSVSVPSTILASSCWSSPTRNVATTTASIAATISPSSANGGSPNASVTASRTINNSVRGPTTSAASVAAAAATIASGLRQDHRVPPKNKDESVASVPAGSSGSIADETDKRVTEECAALQRRLDQLRRRHHQLSQRVHRVQTKSGVEVAYSELKEVVARGQEIFRMPCLMSKSGQLAAQMAQKEEKAGTGVARHLSEQDRSKVTRRCGIHAAVISTSEKLCDSSATESSSEEEDMPAKMDFFNGKQKLTPFRYATRDASTAPRHPAWRWAAQRAAMGARWTWLQAQVSELEYRIRQQHELCRQLKASKQPCLQFSPQHPPLESCSSPGPQLASSALTGDGHCARTVPLNDNFRKRRLVLAQRVPSYAAESVPMDALQPSCDCAAFYPRLELCARCSLLHAQSRRERLELCEEQRPVQLHSGLSTGGGGHSTPHGSHHVGLTSAAAHDAQLARQLLSSPSGERQSEGARLAGHDEPFHGVLSGREDVSLSMHYESLLRAGYSSVLYKNAYAPAHAAAAAAAAAASSSSSSSANSETIADAVTAGRRKEVAIREDGSSGGSSGTVMGTNAESANASRDESSPSAPKRKRHSSHAASRASKNERKSTGGSGNSSRPAAAAAAEPAVAKKRRSDRSRLTSLTSAARRSNSVDSQELADEETIADTNAERNNSHPNRPRKTSYVSQQESSYDIDNIIPYGMMSCTRLVERLKYKEILTPKWRLVHISPEGPSAKAVAASPGEGLCSDAILTPPDGLDTNSSTSALDGEEIPDRDKDVHIGAESGELACDGGGDDDIEDVSDSALQTRHARQEALERERFSAYLKPKLSHQSGPSSTSSVSAGANSRRARIDSATDINTTSGGGGLRSKESSAPGTSSKVKESEESGIHSGSDRGPPTPAAGGKSKEDVSSSHSTKAKRQHRSMSQDWTMLQSSTAPTPYAPRQFPLSDAEWERMQSENPVQSSGGTTTAATTIGDKEDKADAGLQEPAVFADENLFVN